LVGEVDLDALSRDEPGELGEAVVGIGGQLTLSLASSASCESR
jgi:hypothetical protein